MKAWTTGIIAAFALATGIAQAQMSATEVMVTAVEVSPATSSLQHVWFKLSEHPAGAPGCRNGSSWVSIQLGAPGSEQILSVGQAAFLSGKKVRIQYTGSCIASNGNNYALINGLRYFE